MQKAAGPAEHGTRPGRRRDDEVRAGARRAVRDGRRRTASPTSSRRRSSTIERPFYLGQFEVTNRQYACFDPKHDSGYIEGRGKDRTTRGTPINAPDQPVVRVSWNEAMAFCRLALAEDRLPLHPAHRGPMGMGLPRRHGHAVLASASTRRA